MSRTGSAIALARLYRSDSPPRGTLSTRCRMKLYSVGFLSLIQAVLFIAFLSTISVFTAPAGPDDADALYANRMDLASARRAAELWSMAVKQDAKNFDSAWKLARADYWLGTHASESGARTVFGGRGEDGA